ncbi:MULTISPECIES: 16S rRNA (uracil(1498)-N(3))-methyltransferase [unclassified Brevundimonas]|uniref:16S rRNA (uracil(1498)-N(3))-methyltransferase n=1 Tax=unclassified Brevundimonas TaxID=2622653 RepID=UPI000CFB39B3|nr:MULTISPECIES: 16S rRNA (uracil(1498)-N(3))-methyltransferase [unclassified Brevundimonas]PRA31736.1 16S rRNA (uracil(1498)-N(3))-methyltransferase [Brevundimonas sp. MYb27]PQZ83609.1 16S rRNA (uracil(1498)-N(3))-methyltransferase [Brevundimonas sp. MYb31]PRB15803.1 16S rRNA (uracil(1498)-N(3))-methyltransferase [Brevundimonas sp. MYb52]PRB36299.1 16S rRNA (uracil(1498)-N(3))-methyltransferase [Brevundimonas sp. MYb46]PRB46973.1 16S rRNA (uracil(1498)-N(3))-methyltransferase [Brevundimonas s
MIRLHVQGDLAPGLAVAPTLDQSRYLTQVMRLKAGDDLLAFNGRHGEWRVSVAEVLKKGVILRAEEQVRAQTHGPDLELIVAVVKKARIETIVEKATELGASRVRLVLTHRTNADRLRLDRLDAIAEEAAEQTGRLDVPLVDDPIKLDTLLDGWDASRRLMFCDETGGAPAIGALTAAGEGKWAILIGPEGGFSPEEGERLRALPFTTAVSLGPRILRADTAAIAALTLWQAAIGDWDR